MEEWFELHNLEDGIMEEWFELHNLEDFST